MKNIALIIAIFVCEFTATAQTSKTVTHRLGHARLEIKKDYLGESVAQYKANHPDADCEVHKTTANCATDDTVAELTVDTSASFAEFKASRGDVPRLVNLVYRISSGQTARDILVKLFTNKFGVPASSFAVPPASHTTWTRGRASLKIDGLDAPLGPQTYLQLILDTDAAADI